METGRHSLWLGVSSETGSTGENGLSWRTLGKRGLPMVKITGQTPYLGSSTAGFPSWLPQLSPREDGYFPNTSGQRAARVFESAHQLSLQ